MPDPFIELEIDGRVIKVTNPEKVFFKDRGYKKIDVINYYLAVADGALRGVRGRPMILKRYVNGAEAEPFFQKRAPSNLPKWMRTAHITFPSGRTADEVVCDEPAALVWVANTGCLDLNPWPVRAEDVDHPDELRIDLDPTPEANWDMVRQVAVVVGNILHEFGYEGYPKTSGSRGIHVNIRVEPKWDFRDLRRCALAIGREVEKRVPELATTKWWKEERHGVFIDYNQNARDRTVASAYSIRPKPDARVSWPIRWDEVPTVNMEDYTIETVPKLFNERGDASAGIDDKHFPLEPLLELVKKQEEDGLGEAPLPPHFPKEENEPPRVQPSKRRMK
jgi:bifunctional non-homologous end joining protein LigD